MFIGRHKELASLSRLYDSDKFEFVVLYGRRRVGKTALINQFVADKPVIYFTGVESNIKQNLENLSHAIMEFVTGKKTDTIFPSYQSALDYVFQIAAEKRIVLVLDEYPYVAKGEASLSSTLQMLIDQYKHSSRLMLILCGSSMSYMEDKVLAQKAPLYGRKTAQILLQPFDFAQACSMLTGFPDEDKAIAYGMTGGTPQYLLQLNDSLSIEDNIRNTFLNPTSALYEEPSNLLKQEIREPALYNAIIAAIAGGASRISEIAGKIGETTAVCATYIRSLISLGIVQREQPYGEKPSAKKTIYQICDPLFRFWYRFVPENASIIARGAADLAWNRIKPYLSDYMGGIFEMICAQYLWDQLLRGKSPMEFSELGRWWGNDPVEKRQTEIDLMALYKDRGLFAECKWKNEQTDVFVLNTLVHRSELFRCADRWLYVFSRAGFSKGCRERAEALGNIALVTYEDMISELISRENPGGRA